MYSGIRFVLLHHLWEKGRNECSGETCFETMAFLPRIAAALCIAPLPKARPASRLPPSLHARVTGWFSVSKKMRLVGWLVGSGNPSKIAGAIL